jgi:glutamate/tyrosine decarboxylase-like PLP-dependent enzyme
MSEYPYAERFEVLRGLPSEGRPTDAIVAELRTMATEEDASWESGKVSGSFYCGDHEHYDFMNEVFGLFSHVNVLQRDVAPSATRFEGEIIAMALDLFHASHVGDPGGSAVEGTTPAGSITSGGTESIISAMFAYREHAQNDLGIEKPNVVLPETAHPAFHKGCHLFGLEARIAPIDQRSTLVQVGGVADLIDDATVAIVGSAGNYGYGTIDPISELSDLAVERGVGLHVDGCLGGYILPFGEQLGFEVPVFDFRLPGVTTLSADTHKYAYGLKGTSTLLFRDEALRRHLYFFQTEWSGGKYMSPGLAGSRSGGLIAATWASMVRMGRQGYLDKARKIFDVSASMQEAVRSHAELRIMGNPTFCFSFSSDEFDIYLVNDALKERGWRLNGQQYPDAIHMAVTGPQTQDGIAETWADDLAAAVAYAKEHRDEKPLSGSIYGGVPGGHTPEADEFIRDVMAGLLDAQQALPPEA